MITAGALGTPERLREDIRRCREMTDKPFGVNLSVTICPHIEEMLEVAIEERVAAIETAVYNAKWLGRRIQAAGIPWIHKVATVVHTIATEQLHGPDVVIVVGIEGSGHKSPIQLPTLITIPMVVRQVSIPVIAAGGIGDARGFLAALAMGADGIMMGTAFMATKECPISDRYKQLLVDGDPSEQKFRERAFAPPNTAEIERIRQGLPREPRPEPEGVPAGWLSTYSDEDLEGEAGDFLRISGGSLAVGVIHRIKTCRELIEDIVTEAEAILTREGPLARMGVTRVA